jgi:Gamma tubulin complex component C-terminal
MERHFTLTPSGDPFILDDLLEIPELVSEPKSVWRPLQQTGHLLALDVRPCEEKHETLPKLRTEFFAFDRHDEPLPELDSLAESTTASEIGEAASNDRSIEDDGSWEGVWSLQEVITGTRENKLVNWDTFQNPQAATPRSAYLSEAAPACFDAFLIVQASHTNTGLPKVVAQHEAFLQSLFELGIGRDSLLYRYDQATAQFVPTTESFALSGLSFDIQHDVLKDVLHVGNCMRELETFVAKPKLEPLPITLGAAISTVLYAVKTELQPSKSKFKTILQMQSLFSRLHCLLQTLQCLVKIILTTGCARDIVIMLTHESERLASCYTWQLQLLHEILARVSAPWISEIEAQAGLCRGLNALEVRTVVSPSAIEIGGRTSGSSCDTPLTPVMELVTESGRCLELLRDQQADHPILNTSKTELPQLSWQASWESIVRIQMQANKYEQSLKMTILKYVQDTSIDVPRLRHHHVDDALWNKEERAEGLSLLDLDAPRVLDRNLGGGSLPIESKLCQLTISALDANTESFELSAGPELCPPLSQSLSLSLIPLLNAQSRLLSFSTLHILFKTLSLRTHIFIQQRFQLLCDGAFASRLSVALFDPDQSAGEGHRVAGRSTGLRLQTREAWPPASSELRLVLMGILSQSYHPAIESRVTNSDDLPGNLSFAIRDLSAEELEKCREASSIEALDFLRLQYKAPPLLDSIITQGSLKKYDKIFKHLLRLLRMQAVARDIVRDVSGRNKLVDRSSQRFRIEIQHFISTLAAYSSEDAIGVPSARFQELLKDVEDAIDRGDFEGTIAKAGSLSRLERLHDELLDRVIRALFLDRRQAQVRAVLDDIFALILRFSCTTRRGEHDEEKTSDTKVMHVEFKKKVGRVVRYLRSQGYRSSGKGHVWDSDGGPRDEPAFERLLVKLDMFDYYS